MKSLAAFLIALLFAASAWAADAAAPAAPDLKAGQATFSATCVACHGADGNSTVPAQPKLAQQHPEYLVKQLEDFKSGARTSAIMKGFASALSEQDMRNVAWWLASQKMTWGFSSDEKLAARGQAIYRGGIMDRHIPACAACHSPNGAGIPIQYPRLGGQFEDYVATQLKQFRSGERANSDVMHDVAHYMTDNEIKAVSDYIAGLR